MHIHIYTGTPVLGTLSEFARGERKLTDLYTGGAPLVLREATNWASRCALFFFIQVCSFFFPNWASRCALFFLHLYIINPVDLFLFFPPF